jgi:hypothetical protein
MSAPVIKFKTVEKVDKIYQILSSESHHGFPVVDHHSNEVWIFPLITHLLKKKTYFLDKL